MPTILKQLLGSEKFVYSLLVMVPVTIFVLTGHMSIAEWRNDALWVYGILVGGKTLQGMASSIASRPAAPAPAIEPFVAVSQVSGQAAAKTPPEPPPPIRSGE